MSRSFWAFEKNLTKVCSKKILYTNGVLGIQYFPNPFPSITHRVPIKTYNCSVFKAHELGKKKVLIVSYQNSFIFVGGVYAS